MINKSYLHWLIQVFYYRSDFFNWSFELSLNIYGLNQKENITDSGYYLWGRKTIEVQFKDNPAQNGPTNIIFK